MKFLAILLLCTIGMAYSMSLRAKPSCLACKSAMGWLRSNDEVLSFMKADPQVSNDFVALLESNIATTDLCSLMTMCENDQGNGGHGGNGGSGGGHGGNGGHGGSW